MFARLDEVEHRYDAIEQQLQSPALDRDTVRELGKEHAALAEIVKAYRQYKALQKELRDSKEILKHEADDELKLLAKEEIELLQARVASSEKELAILLLPKDPNDEKNVLLEIRAGTGGEEASLFAADLTRMYQRFAEQKRWQCEHLSATLSANGGYKEIILLISGNKVYSFLKFERGVHRVQRVPTTESQGRIHTSACTVAVMPEADAIDIKVDQKDLEISVCRASGAGGQHVNTTDSAVRIVHKPTGTVVECQDERSQLKNKERALKILYAKLYEQAEEQQQQSISADRKLQVGSGDRSEKIRTYNFPQGRVSDHRINLTLYRLAAVMDGDLQEIITALHADHRSKML
ncbi:MAG: peptide chain release factor 1 [Pseudomonadota bacterium]|nr:peptide chain release factor 1 [Pseudomonadota bacterium]